MNVNDLHLAFLRAISRPKPVRVDASPAESGGLYLTDAARTLGVSREHLSRVLHGHRQSRSLTKRFTSLLNGETA